MIELGVENMGIVQEFKEFLNEYKVIGWGAFLSALINFVIIAVVIFLMAKFVLGETKVTKK